MLRLDASTDSAMLAAAWWQIGASVAAIALAFIGIVLAYRTAADQKANRAFQSDRDAAVRFAADTKEVTGGSILGSKFERQSWMGVLERAMTRYLDTVSNAEAAFGAYFTECRQRITALAEAQESGNTTISAEAAAQLINFDIDGIRNKALNWIYPEYRREILTTLFRERADAMPNVPNKELLIKGWLIQAQPSYSAWIQRARLRWHWVRVALDDTMHGRLPGRIRERRIARRDARAFRASIAASGSRATGKEEPPSKRKDGGS